jgi:serine/threonine protein kinase
VGSGATGDAIRIKDSDVVVKQCDSYNNPVGFKMLQNEILVYKKLTELKGYPRYYGECEFYGQYFIALEFIPGEHCDWKANRKLRKKMDMVIENLKSHGVVHQVLRPENVLLTRDGDIKLIDFGKADIRF